MFPPVIQTPRLRFEPASESLDPMQAYEYYSGRHAETIAEETRFLSWDPHPHPKETRDVLEVFGDGWENGEDAVYAVTPREGEDGAGEFAGTTGLHLDWERRTGVLGIWLRKPFWGRGYSGERALALAELAFEHLDLELVAVTCQTQNEQSRRAIEKYMAELGGRCEGRMRNRIVVGDAVEDVCRFSVSREEWLAASPDSEASFEW